MEKTRTIITTDLECDDMNSLIHLCLHLNELDVQAIIYTASRYHFNGDGIHTLGEITPHFSCSGKRSYEQRNRPPGPDPAASELKEFRPFEEGWIESLFRNEYAAVWSNLCLHDSAYPSPEEMLSRIYYGNISFEGDVTKETEGSSVLVQAMLDEQDERTLYIQSWGGINTVVRALMTIEETYRDTPEWNHIHEKVCQKVRILGVINGVGQDNSWLDHAAKTWKDIVLLRSEFPYGAFFSSIFTQPDSIDTYKAPWLKENIKFDHGPLMNKTILMGDGTCIKGEPDNRQFGLITYIDWGMDSFPRVDFEQYDWLGEGDSMTWVPLLPNGLKGLQDGSFGSIAGRMFKDGEEPFSKGSPFQKQTENVNPFLYAFQKEWAARADWCVKPYKECAHPPVVSVDETELFAYPGETVQLHGNCNPSDGKPIHIEWFVYKDGRRIDSEELLSCDKEECTVTVSSDAVPGECLIICLACETEGFPSITRYAETAVHII